MKKSVEVSIMGKRFVVRSESDETYVQQVAQLVNTRISEIMAKTQSAPSVNVVILAAMNIADDYLKYKEKQGSRTDTVRKKIQRMLELIDLNS